MTGAREESTASKALRGTKWMALSVFSGRALQPVVLVCLARILAPDDFGVAAIGALVLGVAALFQDLGLRAALIQRKEEEDGAEDAVFFTVFLAGAVWYALVYFLSPHLAGFFGDERLVSVIRVACVSILVAPFGMVQGALLRKRFDFKRLFYINLFPSLAQGAVSVVLAVMGFSYWALIWGNLANTILSTAILWFKVKWRPSFSFGTGAAGKMFKFGGWVSLDNFFTWALANLDRVFVGRGLGTGALGVYKMGFNAARLPELYTTGWQSYVMYPAFSELKERKLELAAMFAKYVKYVSLVVFPSAVLMAVMSESFVSVVLGGKWLTLVPMLRVLSFFGAASALMLVFPQALRAVGRPDLVFKLTALRAAVTLPLVAWAVSRGLFFVCAVQTVSIWLFLFLTAYAGVRALGMSVSGFLKTLYPAFVSSSVLGGFLVFVLCPLLEAEGLNDALRLFISAGLSASAYFGLLMILDRETIVEGKRLFLRVVG